MREGDALSLPKGWEIKTLGEVCDISNGSTPLRSKKEFWDNGNVNWFTINDIRNQGRIINYTNQKITKEGYEKSSLRVLPPKTVLLCCTASVGEYAITNIELTTNQQFNGLIAKDFNLLLPEYLFYFSSTLKEQLLSVSGKTTIDFVSMTKVKKVQIPVPTIEEQKQIVALLDKAFASIDQAKANIEKNIVNAKELFQSKLNDIFSQKGDGWEEKTLGELGTLTSSKRIYKKEYVKEGIPFYRSKEIKELAHRKDITLELFITKERYNEIKSRFGIPQEGDILLTAVGTIGEMYVVKNNEPDFYFKDGNIMWLKNFSTLNSYYLKYALLCFVEQLKAMSQGSAYSALTIEKLKKYSISVPSITEQEKIVNQLNDLLNKKIQVEKNYDKKIMSLEELKKSILQKAFAGELTQKEVAV
jgi:type I restriction enzyme S subunit